MSDNKHKDHLRNTDNEDTILFTSPNQPRPQSQRPSQPTHPQQQYYNGQQPPPPRPQQQYYNGQQAPPPRPQQQYYNGQQAPPTRPQQQYYNSQQAPPTRPQQQYYNGQQAPPPHPQQQYYNGQQTPPTHPQQQYYNGQQAPPPHPQQQYYNSQQPVYGYPPPYYAAQPSKPDEKRKKSRKKPKSEKKPEKKKKHKSLIWKIIRRILLSLIILFIIIFGIYSCTSLSLIGKMNHVPTGDRIRTQGAMNEKHVTNVLIIGTDGRTESDRGRSDSMILISLNSKTNEMIMTSFLRDCYVEIRGHGKDKLNASYAYGGPELLMDTIESNFNIKIDDYLSINFSTFASVIDSAGGVKISLSDEEAEAVNVILMSEVNELMGDDRNSDLLSGGGNILLNGKQALSYSRIRSVGKWDLERTSRQRKVITALIKKARSEGVSFVGRLTKKALPYITTNMDKKELYLLSLRVPLLLNYDIAQLQIPADGTFTNVSGTPSGDVLETDFESNIKIIADKIFAQ